MWSARLPSKIEQMPNIEAPSTTKMSSKGQVVIPEAIRKRLGLNPGVEFVVVAQQGHDYPEGDRAAINGRVR